MFDKTLKLMLLLSPIAYTTGIAIDTFDLRAFSLYVMALFAASLVSKPQRDVDMVPLDRKSVV